MFKVEAKKFNKEDDAVWESLFTRLDALRSVQMHPVFCEGLELLEIPHNKVPDLDLVNKRLQALTGFKGVPVEGFIEPKYFFEMLVKKEFPIGNFIRSPEDLSYTPAPDIFHDLYGHLPFLTNKDYANFCIEFGQRACAYSKNPEITKQWETLFWFGVEFPLIKTPEGTQIFGGGIASSFDECAYSLSDKPTVLKFDIEAIRHRPYRIDEMQGTLFILENTDQLYSSLGDFEKGCIKSNQEKVTRI